MSRKIELKSNVRVLSANFQDSRYSYNKSIDSTINGKDTQFTQSQIHLHHTNNSYFQYQELKEADQKQECSIIQNTSKKVSRQDLHRKTSKRSLDESQQHFNLSKDQAKVIQLSQRLRNLKFFYKYMISYEKRKNLQKNQTIMTVIDIMQNNHMKKIQQLKEKELMLRENTTNKKKKQLQQQGRFLKKQNDKLVQEINLRKTRISEKEKLSEKLQRQKYELLDELQKVSNRKNQTQVRNQEINKLLNEFRIQIYRFQG